MVLLADKASDDGTGIWASKQRMADELCCSKQTVINTLKRLIEDGLVVEVGQRKCANGFTIEYAINVQNLDQIELTKWHADQSTRLTGQRALPVKEIDLTSQRDLPHQSTSLTQTPLNPIEPPNGKAENDVSAFTCQDFMETWNEVADQCNLPKLRKLTKARRRAFAVRKKEYPEIDDWKRAFGCLRKTAWMHGDNDRGWKADPDFFLQAKSFTKLTEGSYASETD